jgi:hypothetical protein
MWLKNLYENVLVDVKCKKYVFVTLKACYSWNKNLMTKYFAGIEFACVFMLKLYDFAGSKERIVVSKAN